VLLFTADRQDTVLKRKRDVLLVDPRKFGFYRDLLIVVPSIWGVSAKSRPPLEPNIPEKAGKPPMKLSNKLSISALRALKGSE
jgi:hypothetical protein